MSRPGETCREKVLIEPTSGRTYYRNVVVKSLYITIINGRTTRFTTSFKMYCHVLFYLSTQTLRDFMCQTSSENKDSEESITKTSCVCPFFFCLVTVYFLPTNQPFYN